jgi:hypothetical protein
MTTTMTARRPDDLLAAVPVLLGFRPEESVVMLTFGARHGFHARLDLPPPDEEDQQDLVDALLTPCVTHDVARVAFAVYTADQALAARVVSWLVPAFVAAGIGVVDALRAHGGMWCSVPIRAGGRESPPRPYDEAAHPFAAQAVLEGRVTRASRDELRRLVAPDAAVRERWGRALLGGSAPGPADEAEARQIVARWVRARAAPDDDGAIRVLRVATRLEVRDAAIGMITRGTACDHARVWTTLLRGAPDEQVPDVAAVVAFCAWQAGDGALAWCALDRCFELDPRHRLGRCLAECLVRAMPPSSWEEMDR